MQYMSDKYWTDDLIDNIVERINLHLIVPIIGPEVYRVDEDGCSYKLQEYIVKELLKLDEIPLEPTAENIVRFSKGYKGMTDLNRYFVEAKITLRTQLIKIYRNSQQKIKLDEDVEKLLLKGNFPLILTTCNFQYLESKIDCVLESKKGREIELLTKGYQAIRYRKERLDIQDIDSPRNLNSPTLFYLFGYVSQDDNVVITEDDFLQYMHCIQDTNTSPKKLKKYMQDKYILSLGCEIPDWTFRFLLYSLKEKDGNLIHGKGYDTFDGGALSPHIDDSLVSFLSDISYFSHHELNKFVTDVNEKINKIIFVSLAADDYDIVGEVIKQKLGRKFKIWLYKDHDHRQYWSKIEEGLQSCDYFMPVIDRATMNRLDNTEIIPPLDIAKDYPRSKGLIAEWQLALAYGKDNSCIPLYLDGVTPKEFGSKLDELDKNRYVWSLFFSDRGTGGLPVNTIDELTTAIVLNHIK